MERRDWKRRNYWSCRPRKTRSRGGSMLGNGYRNTECSSINFSALKIFKPLLHSPFKSLWNWSISRERERERGGKGLRTRHQPSLGDTNEMNPCFIYRFNLFIVKKSTISVLNIIRDLKSQEKVSLQFFQFISCLLYHVRKW